MPASVSQDQRPAALHIPGDRKACALPSAKVMDKWADECAGVRAAAEADNVIQMFDVIGEDYWTGGGITAKTVAAQLKVIGDKPVTVQINSPGGDMFEGIAIYNVLREHGQEVTVQIMGMAASAASIIAMAGDSVEIGAASFLMIHNCWVIAVGNANDMRALADWLDPFDQAMRDVYVARSGLKPEEVAQMMDDETYLSGAKAIDLGLADVLLSSDKVKEDASAKAAARELTDVRALELAAVASGKMTRTAARARIQNLKGTPGAVLPVTPGADETDWVEAMNALTQSLKS